MVLETLPPNFKQIELYITSGSFKPAKGEIYPYAPYIFNPNKTYIDPPLLIHLFTHISQQEKIGVKEWWSRYLKDKHFRLNEEIRAFQAQFHEIKSTVKDRERLNKIVHYLSLDLMAYGLARDDARKALQSDKLVETKKAASDLVSGNIFLKLGKLLTDKKYNEDLKEQKDSVIGQKELKKWKDEKERGKIFIPLAK